MRKDSFNNIGRKTDAHLLQALHILFTEIQKLKTAVLHSIQVDDTNIELRDTAYVKDTVGVSDRTLLRYQNLGLIRVHQRDKGGKKYFKLDDVLRLKRYLNG
ncbi:MerR family transcriptional regulator [Sphingobacterium sp.]|uniref:MerR family transcriptional regulator n=1 Tax=unclassified Sphingobacterium TaxID=2609468 RepID=UPI0028A83FB3|nr:MerR family transcriptional regulator [Sphingobacterium sp.]